MIFDPACSTQSLFVHPTRFSSCSGLPWDSCLGRRYSQHRKFPGLFTQKYLTGAEVERLMVVILLAEVILIIPGALVILLPPYCGRAERDVGPAASRHPGPSKRK